MAASWACSIVPREIKRGQQLPHNHGKEERLTRDIRYVPHIFDSRPECQSGPSDLVMIPCNAANAEVVVGEVLPH